MRVILAALFLSSTQEEKISLPRAPDAATRQGERGDLVLNVLRNGTMEISGKTVFRPPAEEATPDLSKLNDIFEARRQMEMWQEERGKEDFVQYTLVLRADRSTPFQYLQFAMMSASLRGGVTRLSFATQGEKSLPCSLPKHHTNTEVQEIRILVCTDADAGPHRENQKRHDAELHRREREDLRTTARDEGGPHSILADVCSTWVESSETGKLYQSRICEAHREEKLDETARSAANNKTHAAIAGLVAELNKRGNATVIIDADAAVPWEHIVGIFHACGKTGARMEFITSPRYP